MPLSKVPFGANGFTLSFTSELLDYERKQMTIVAAGCTRGKVLKFLGVCSSLAFLPLIAIA